MLPSSVLIVSRIILTRNATENLIRYPILSSGECEECLPASPGGKTPATARQHTRLQQVKTDTDRRKCYIALLAVLSVRCSYQTHTERMTKTHVHDSHTERATQKDRRKLHLCLTEQYANQCKVGNRILIQRTPLATPQEQIAKIKRCINDTHSNWQTKTRVLPLSV